MLCGAPPPHVTVGKKKLRLDLLAALTYSEPAVVTPTPCQMHAESTGDGFAQRFRFPL